MEEGRSLSLSDQPGGEQRSADSSDQVEETVMGERASVFTEEKKPSQPASRISLTHSPRIPYRTTVGVGYTGGGFSNRRNTCPLEHVKNGRGFSPKCSLVVVEMAKIKASRCL